MFIQAYDQAYETPKEKQKEDKEFEVPEEAFSEDTFPPCIKLILDGMGDGKKRGLFCMINFFKSVGWSDDMVEDLVVKWNKKNPEPLREVIIKGQLNHKKGKVMMPPNCNRENYYRDLAVCRPDGLCRGVVNPVQYAKKKHNRLEELQQLEEKEKKKEAKRREKEKKEKEKAQEEREKREQGATEDQQSPKD